ncbi:hypothetical protein QE152_g25064 [Popillia japonica]|uniref:Integrase catalytic domain-containing protein n=1 Tax=Popillia japonica TaxID=7064 RepID=A0AAW1K2Q7_POPJA
MGITVIFNATATPHASGQVERYNRTILNSLEATVSQEEMWDLDVSKIQWGLNSTVNAATGKSPYQLFFGYEPRDMADAFLLAKVGTYGKAGELGEIRLAAAERIARGQSQNKMRRNTTNNDGKSKKLLPKYEGPFQVAKVLCNDRYEIADLPGSKRSTRKYVGVSAADHMKPFVAFSESDDESDDNTGENGSPATAP